MMVRRRSILTGTTGTLAMSFCSPEASLAETHTPLKWSDLLPKGEAEEWARQRAIVLGKAAPHGSLSDEPISMGDLQFGTFNTVRSLNGRSVRIKGYVVPLDVRMTTLEAFLLVPFFGACLHAPPPPPNQTLYVRSATPVRIDSLYRPVEVWGAIRINRTTSDMGASAYEMQLQRLVKL